jgi:trans-aconitate methyltransferase
VTADRVRVSTDWLALREPADAAARSRGLVRRLRRRLPASDRLMIHDLGCGAGAMGRWLAPLLPRPQHWVLHDQDADLLRVAAVDTPERAADGDDVTVETRRSDLTRLRPDDLAGANLITASALLDMLTGDELTAMLAACAGVGSPLLLTLSVVGEVALEPADPLDRHVRAAFNANQRRRIERGRLLGPDAAAFAATELHRPGADVLVRRSPWRLGAAQANLIVEWFSGWVGAAREQRPGLATELDRYGSERLAQARAGRLVAAVGHVDLLALPGGRLGQSLSNRGDSA